MEADLSGAGSPADTGERSYLKYIEEKGTVPGGTDALFLFEGRTVRDIFAADRYGWDIFEISIISCNIFCSCLV